MCLFCIDLGSSWNLVSEASTDSQTWGARDSCGAKIAARKASKNKVLHPRTGPEEPIWNHCDLAIPLQFEWKEVLKNLEANAGEMKEILDKELSGVDDEDENDEEELGAHHSQLGCLEGFLTDTYSLS